MDPRSVSNKIYCETLRNGDEQTYNLPLTINRHFFGMPVDPIRGAVETAIQRASAVTGVDFGFLLGTARRESGLNPSARASTSSAAGLFQFVEQTWLATLKTHGAKYGYARYAALIDRGADGRYRVADAEARKTVMDLRFDPRAASLMVGELTADNAAYLRGSVGRDPTGGELYAAHFLGPQGSARLIRAVESNPNGSAVALFPDAARANRSIFYKDGRPATVAELYANLTSTHGGGGVNGGSASFIQYASGRQVDRLEVERQLVDLLLRGSDGELQPTSSIFDAALMRATAYAQARGG